MKSLPFKIHADYESLAMRFYERPEWTTTELEEVGEGPKVGNRVSYLNRLIGWEIEHKAVKGMGPNWRIYTCVALPTPKPKNKTKGFAQTHKAVDKMAIPEPLRKALNRWLCGHSLGVTK